ncbi:hypothetical protein JCGZ_10293 [Jatropha curcas]|uniref:Uncharacterized protein n=1 Tax=Jatropha curcas TaxID=180498 RepID=A0A067KJD1_JATCU|nr:hypothetical protein JCGZ_10293 [Jatropha curcas]
MHLDSRLVGIGLDSRYAAAIYVILIIQEALPKLREVSASGGDKESIDACLSHWNHWKWHGSSKIGEEVVEGGGLISSPSRLVWHEGRPEM